MVEVDYKHFSHRAGLSGVDSPEDAERAEAILLKDEAGENHD